METNLEVLNKISQKLGGESDATSVTESLNNIANALGDTNPDVIKSVSDSLNDILEYAGQGGGGGLDIKPLMEFTLVNNTSSAIDTFMVPYGTIINNTVYSVNNVTLSPIPSGESGKFTVIATFNSGYNNSYVTEALLPDYDTTPFSGPVVSDEVNCSYDLDYGIFYITDPTQNASVTLTVSDE